MDSNISITQEEAKHFAKEIGKINDIGNKVRRIDEKMFRENLLPIFLNDENREHLNVYVAFTGSPYLGVIVTRNGRDAYEVPAVFNTRFNTFNLSEINSDGYTEEQRRVNSLGSQSPIRMKNETNASIQGIKGKFTKGIMSTDMTNQTRAMWVNVFKENGIDIYSHYGIEKPENEPKAISTIKSTTGDDWGCEEL